MICISLICWLYI